MTSVTQVACVWGLALAACGSAHADDARLEASASLQDLVCREYGFSYRQARMLPASAIAEARAVLADEGRKHCRKKTVLFLGVRGQERELDQLLEMARGAERTSIDMESFTVLLRIPYAIGLIAGRHPRTPLGERATQSLVRCTDTAFWDRARRRWSFDGGSEAAQATKLSRSCIAALAFTRSPSARSHLAAIAAAPGGPRPQGDAADALREMQVVERSASLDAYLESMDEAAADDVQVGR
jgi:hypothetical protein